MNVVYDSEGIFYELQLNTPKYQVSGDRPAMIAKQLMMSPQIEAIGGLYPHVTKTRAWMEELDCLVCAALPAF